MKPKEYAKQKCYNINEKVLEAVENNDGYCPCRLDKTEDTVCPCRLEREDGDCCCNLFNK